MVQSKIELKTIVKENTLASDEFHCKIDEEWKKTWNRRSIKCKNKIKWLKEKQDAMYRDLENKHLSSNKEKPNVNKKLDNDPLMKRFDHIIEEVNYKDKDMKKVDKNNKVVKINYDRMDVNMEEILSKPPGHTVYRKVSRENVEISAEEAFCKLRYNKVYENTVKDVHNGLNSDKIYDMDMKVINFNNMKATEMKCNKRVNIIEPDDITFETKCEYLFSKVMETYEEYDKNNENVEFSNLTENEKQGTKDVISAVRENKFVVFHTDKSKKFSVETKDSYKDSMKPHIQDKKELSQSSVSKIITKMNDANKSVVKIIGIGKSNGQDKRALNNVHMSSQTQLPVLNGLHKDHKAGNNKRQLVNGNIGPVSNLSNTISDILEPYLEEIREKVEGENTCKSVEELISHFIKFNSTVNEGKNNKFISSMDVKSLFPSLTTQQCTKAVISTIKSSELKVKGLNFKEMGVFLRKNLNSKEIHDKKLQNLVPNKNKKNKLDENKVKKRMSMIHGLSQI